MNMREEVELYLGGGINGKTVPPQDAEKFALLCERTGLSPIARQIYLTPKFDKQKGTVWTPLTSIDGFRAVADRQPNYLGQKTYYLLKEDGEWTDKPPSKAPYACKVVIRKKIGDAVGEIEAVAVFSQYVVTGNQGFMWTKMPALMIAKCTEALAIRKAFPNQCQGLYTVEEMAQAGFSVPPPTQDKGEEIEASGASQALLEGINQAANLAELTGLVPEIKKLSDKDRTALLGPYNKRKAKLASEQSEAALAKTEIQQ